MITGCIVDSVIILFAHYNIKEKIDTMGYIVLLNDYLK